MPRLLQVPGINKNVTAIITIEGRCPSDMAFPACARHPTGQLLDFCTGHAMAIFFTAGRWCAAIGWRTSLIVALSSQDEGENPAVAHPYFSFALPYYSRVGKPSLQSDDGFCAVHAVREKGSELHVHPSPFPPHELAATAKVAEGAARTDLLECPYDRRHRVRHVQSLCCHWHCPDYCTLSLYRQCTAVHLYRQCTVTVPSPSLSVLLEA